MVVPFGIKFMKDLNFGRILCCLQMNLCLLGFVLHFCCFLFSTRFKQNTMILKLSFPEFYNNHSFLYSLFCSIRNRFLQSITISSLKNTATYLGILRGKLWLAISRRLMYIKFFGFRLAINVFDFFMLCAIADASKKR